MRAGISIRGFFGMLIVSTTLKPGKDNHKRLRHTLYLKIGVRKSILDNGIEPWACIGQNRDSWRCGAV
jgi:hypothetical protein